MASGFSQKMAFPAAAAALVSSPWVAVGVTITTASTEGSAMRSPGVAYPRGTSNARVTSSTTVLSTSATATSRVHAIRVARSRAYTRPSLPNPIRPTFSFVFVALFATCLSCLTIPSPGAVAAGIWRSASLDRRAQYTSALSGIVKRPSGAGRRPDSPSPANRFARSCFAARLIGVPGADGQHLRCRQTRARVGRDRLRRRERQRVREPLAQIPRRTGDPAAPLPAQSRRAQPGAAADADAGDGGPEHREPLLAGRGPRRRRYRPRAR